MPLAEQEALRTFEDDRLSGLQLGLPAPFVGDHPALSDLQENLLHAVDDLAGRELLSRYRAAECAQLFELPRGRARQLLPEEPGVEQIASPQRSGWIREGVLNRLAEAHPAAPVPGVSPPLLAGAVHGAVEGGRDQRLAVDQEPGEAVGHAGAAQRLLLGPEGQGIDDHVAREQRLHAGDEAPRAELREGVVPPIGGHDVVAGLRAAVEAHHRGGARPPHQGVGDVPLAGVAEAEIDDGERASGQPSALEVL